MPSARSSKVTANEHQSDTYVLINEDGNLIGGQHKQALEDTSLGARKPCQGDSLNLPVTDDAKYEHVGQRLKLTRWQSVQDGRSVETPRHEWPLGFTYKIPLSKDGEVLVIGNLCKAMINQYVTAALATRDASTNGQDNHNLGNGVRRMLSEMVNPELLDKKISTLAELHAKNKRKLKHNNQSSTTHLLSEKIVAQAYAAMGLWEEGIKKPEPWNQVVGTGARGLVHALGGGETDSRLNDIEDDISVSLYSFKEF
ncbi:hypothetical protein Tco_0123608 [Tanacetum coccineum]